jgi:DNA polymerase-3 subunit delta'
MDVWSGVVGKDAAVAQLTAAAVNPVHAYLLVGPAGSGKRAAARGFAALLLASGSTGEEAERHVRLALAEAHPDLRVVEPTLATGGISTKDAKAIVKQAVLSPAEGSRKVILLEDFHLIGDAAAVLLKYVEEPPPSTFFVILAEDVPPELVTIASRAVRVDLGRIPLSAVAERLVAEGVDPERATSIAAAAAGDLDRARLLATDARFALRADALRAMPHRLDGTGARAAELAAEVKALIDDAQDAIDARHAAEVVELDERIDRYGMRGSGKKDIEERQKREVRRHRTAELRFALATFAAAYRDALPTAPHPDRLVAGLHRIDDAALSLERFPNESLLLQSLLAHLPPLPS